MLKYLKFYLLGFGVFFVFNQFSFANLSPKNLKASDVWLKTEVEISKNILARHLLMKGIAQGAVIASPQKDNPNYFRHWVRDSAIVMASLVPLARESRDPQWRVFLNDYIRFSLSNQSKTSNLGEPIFEVNGDLFTGPWGRPQNDGPALRALAMISWADYLLSNGDSAAVEKDLYKAELPAKTLIKADLEYVANHWQQPSFDLWEEVRGDHFFTRMTQYRALSLGADFADRMKDTFAANFYRKVAVDIGRALENHVNKYGKILPTLNYKEGVNYKNSNIDIAVILGVLRGENALFPVDRAEVKASFEDTVKAFENLYSVNVKFSNLAPAMGRYPEDVYSGSDFNGGNPWVLATLAGAEYCFKQAALSTRINQSNFWLNRGDSFLARVQLHANPDGSLSEQIQRESGYMVSARDLSWNYAAILDTASARTRALTKRLYLK